jgi:ABC-type ATPase with predicted acetyltransferase domain
MALVKCTECGSQISNTAQKCPNCGAQQNLISQIIGAIITCGLMLYFSSDLVDIYLYIMRKGE